MAEQKQEQAQLLIPANQVMSAFCYAYCKALLDKLKTLEKRGELAETRDKRCLTKIAFAVCNKLADQTSLSNLDIFDADRVPAYISQVEEFLDIFKS